MFGWIVAGLLLVLLIGYIIGHQFEQEGILATKVLDAGLVPDGLQNDGPLKITAVLALFAKSPKGTLIESVCARLHGNSETYDFPIWFIRGGEGTYSGAGMRIAHTGTEVNCHFLQEAFADAVTMRPGDWEFEIFVTVHGTGQPRSVARQTFTLSEDHMRINERPSQFLAIYWNAFKQKADVHLIGVRNEEPDQPPTLRPTHYVN